MKNIGYNSLVVKKGETILFRIAKDGKMFVEEKEVATDIELANLIWDRYTTTTSEELAEKKVTDMTALLLSTNE